MGWMPQVLPAFHNNPLHFDHSRCCVTPCVLSASDGILQTSILNQSLLFTKEQKEMDNIDNQKRNIAAEKRKMVGLFVASNIIGVPLMKYVGDTLESLNLKTFGRIVKTTGPMLLDTWKFVNNNYNANVHNMNETQQLDARIKILEAYIKNKSTSVR